MGEINALAPGIEITLFNNSSKYYKSTSRNIIFTRFIINISYIRVELDDWFVMQE